jgi:hypothetical protein
MAFMRQYGMEGDPGPRLAPRRKTAASGPRAKAARKRVVRGQRAARGKQGAPKGPGKKKAKGGGFNLGALGADRIAGAIDQLRQGNLIGAAGQAVLGSGRHIGGAGMGHRRTKNPANVKALRRALSRVEGFGKLVTRVNRMLPRAHKFAVHPVLKHKRGRGKRC